MLLKGKATLITTLLLILSFGFIAISFISSPDIAEADTAVKIKDFKIITNYETLGENDPLVAGVNYSIEFTVDVAAGVNDTIVLQTRLERKGDRFWQNTNDYAGLPGNWTPAQQSIKLNPEPGTATFILSGFIPEDYNKDIIESGSVSITLHRTSAITLLTLSLESSGEVLDEKPREVIDESILNYRSLWVDRQKMLDETSTVSQYRELVRKVINEASEKGEAGFTETAKDLLETIPTSNWPSESKSNSSILYIILIIILAVVAILAIVLLLRSKSTVGFLKQRADDQSKRLEIVEARIQKIGERSLASEVTQVKDALRSMGR